MFVFYLRELNYVSSVYKRVVWSLNRLIYSGSCLAPICCDFISISCRILSAMTLVITVSTAKWSSKLKFWHCACSWMTDPRVTVWMTRYCHYASSRALNQWPERKDFHFIECKKKCRLLGKWILMPFPWISPHLFRTLQKWISFCIVTARN
jgi:hypothetical protein